MYNKENIRNRRIKKVKNRTINRKKKLFIHIIVIAILVFFSFNFVLAKTNDIRKTTTITVLNGDTLWSIASNICDNNHDLYILEIMHDIKNLNNMNNSNIYEGQELIIYVY